MHGLEFLAGGLVAEELLGSGVTQTTCTALANGAQCKSGLKDPQLSFGAGAESAAQYETVGGVCKCYTGILDAPDDNYICDKKNLLGYGLQADKGVKGVAVCYLPADPTPAQTSSYTHSYTPSHTQSYTPAPTPAPTETNLLSYEIYSAQTCSASSIVFAFSVEVVTSKSAFNSGDYFYSPCRSTTVDFTNGTEKYFLVQGLLQCRTQRNRINAR
jgi:hypothetical protein